MNNFIELYNEVMRNPTEKTRVGASLCQAGIAIVQSTDNLELKKDILTRLISLYPEDPSLYYYMGFALKVLSPEKAFYYYEKSFKINPYNIENMIDFCDILVQKGCYNEVLKLNTNGLFDHFLHDWRFMVLYYQCIKGESCLESIHYIEQVISHLTSYDCKTDKEKEVMVSANSHLASMYNSLSEQVLTMKYAEKSLKYAKLFKRPNKEWLTTMATYLFLLNFDYYDGDIIREQSIKANDYIESSHGFDFTGREPGKKIRLGYVSSDFTNHAVSNFIIPILKNHNREVFDVYLYVNQSQIHEQLLELELPYVNISNMKDQAVAELIYDEKIDILIDLNGYTNNNRIGVFAMNPAPIQITYLGFPNTTGLSCFQYRITDRVTDPIDSKQYYSEKLIRLPKCFLLYESFKQSKPSIPRVTKDIVILGSLNKEGKTNSHVLAAWKTILKECPNTRLLIKLDSVKDSPARLEFYMKHLSVGKDRLILIGKLDDEGYVKLFKMVDVVLDTFPYSGTTTTCNSLYNSLPVVTMARPDCHAHNVSASLLTNTGLSELITGSMEEYVGLVKSLVMNPAKIDEYKGVISGRFLESMNPARFMLDYEDALLGVKG